MRKLYRETMEELRAPQDKLEEIIAMTEPKYNKKKFSVRPLLAAAAAVAILTVGVSAANLEEVQTFLYKVISMNQVDAFRTDITTEGGDVTLFDMSSIHTDTVDGRVILTVGDEILDITDELAADGEYAYQKTLEGTEVHVNVSGTPEEYNVWYSMDVPGGEGPTVRYTIGPDGNPVVEADGSREDGSTYVSVYSADGESGEAEEIYVGFEGDK